MKKSLLKPLFLLLLLATGMNVWAEEAIIVEPPTISPESGSEITQGSTIEIQFSTENGCYLCYSTDGSDPLTGGFVSVAEESPLIITADEVGELTVKAITCFDQVWEDEETGETNYSSYTSEIVTATYTVVPAESEDVDIEKPVISPESGNINYNDEIEITYGEGCRLLYTTNGTDPVNSEAATWTDNHPAIIHASTYGEFVVKAVAYYDGEYSEVTTATYYVNEAPIPDEEFDVTEPIFSPESGEITQGTEIVIQYTEVPDSYIRYTTDGTDPKTSNTAVFDTQHPATFTAEEVGELTVKAVACVELPSVIPGLDGGEEVVMATFYSDVVTATYDVVPAEPNPPIDPEDVDVEEPVISPESGEITQGTEIEITFNAEGIFYTTDGTDPMDSETAEMALESPLTLTADEIGELTVKAVAFIQIPNEYSTPTYWSDVVTATYTVVPGEPAPSIMEIIPTRANGYGTYCSDVDLDFSAVSAKAYIARLSGTQVILTEVQQVPAGTGILVKSDGSDEVSVPAAIDAVEPITATNDFIGVLEDTEVEYGTVSVLSLVDGEEGFYKFLGTIIPAHKAYFPTVADNANAKLSLVFDDTDAITDISTDAANAGERYNLNGQRVDNSYKGVVIVNGRKYFKK